MELLKWLTQFKIRMYNIGKNVSKVDQLENVWK